QADRAGKFTRDEFRDQRAGSLSRAPELQHVHPVIIRLDDGRQRAAFTQRRDVSRDADRSQGIRLLAPERTSRSNAKAAKDAKKEQYFLAAFAAFAFQGDIA